MVKNLMFLLVLLLPFVLSAQKESKSTEQFLEEIDQNVPQLLHDFSIPGAAIAIIEDGEIVLQKGYGFSDIEKGLQVDTKTGFNIGSISKTVAAWGIMKLVHEGKIDLDAPAENYLTRWHLPESAFDSDAVTIRRLLSHTAGLSLGSVSPGPPYDNLPTIEAWLSGENNGLGPVEIILEPGTKWEYSGGGYGVLQLIIEEVSGQTFEDYMQAQIIDPLGMTNSSFKIDEKIIAASASPYDNYGEKTDFELFTVQAGAGFHTTLEDFTRFAMASFYRHKDNSTYNSVLPTEIIQQMMEPVPPTNGGWRYGLGYQTVHPGNSQVFCGHSGTNNGWQANFRMDPASNDGFIVFTNGGSGDYICNLLFCEWYNWKTGESSWSDCYPKRSIGSKLKQEIDKKGIEDIAAAYVALKKDLTDEYDFSESQLNELGYYYMGRKELEKAIAIFKLNIEVFPNDYNVYDSYGEALLAQGAREEAIKYYKKSIQLNPGNENGIRVMNKLGISADDIIESISVAMDTQILTGYVGRYQTSTGEIVTIKKSEGHLAADMEEQKLNLVAQSATRFSVLGEGAIVTFFTAATGQKGLWARQRIWRKLPNASASADDNKGSAQHSIEQARSTGNFLIFRNKSSWNRLTDFENVLTEIGCNYEQRESSKMANLDLSAYDVIIIPGAQDSTYYNDYVSNVERFDEFVAKGGTLVLELNGADKNKSFILPLGITIAPHKAFENEIIESDHPIFFPLSGKRFIRARYTSNGYLQHVPDDALILAVEAEGTDTFKDRPTFIEYPYGEGQVIAASQCLHDRDSSGRGPLMESVISYALTKSWATED